MKKIAFITIIVMTALLAYIMQVDWTSQKFTDALSVNPDNIAKLQLSLPGESNYATTRDPKKIQKFIQYFSSKNYKRIRGDEPTELPMSASMVYLYGKDQTDFLVVFGDTVLISHQYYNVKDDIIEMTFLKDFHQAIK
ncbi:hypothetical protein [Lentibacillus kapialis]|nr:hypothetical protein [Lentibacillus kapialis]